MSLLSRAQYRVRQLRRTLSPNVTAKDRREAESMLGPNLYPLFAGMQPADQRHCLDVYRLLRAQGEDDPDVLTAALIHDAGKSDNGAARIRTWHRVAYVALPGFAIERLARGNGGFARLQGHGEATLRLAREANTPDSVLALLEAMEAHNSDDSRAARLLAADDAC